METAITFVLSNEDKKRIKKFAQQETRTVSNWVRKVIESELKRLEKEETNDYSKNKD